MRVLLNPGVSGIWTDMNEPSDFLDMTGDTQANVVSEDGGTHSPYAKNRNVFALGMARATFEGLQRLQPDRRPYWITQAGYACIPRFSTLWLPDTVHPWHASPFTLPLTAP